MRQLPQSGAGAVSQFFVKTRVAARTRRSQRVCLVWCPYTRRERARTGALKHYAAMC